MDLLKTVFNDIGKYFNVDSERIIAEQLRSNSICVAALSDLSRLLLTDAPLIKVDATKPVCDEIRTCMEAKAKTIDSWREDGSYPKLAIAAYRHCLADQPEPLGRYFSGQDISSSRIELYWLSIGIAAADMGVSIEDLTQVVLLHEWAHAFTHWGQDSDECCLAGYFSQLERPGLVEGLAQYWTHYASQFPGMTPEAFKTYAELMNGQKPEYREHLWWLCLADLKKLQDVVGDNIYAKFPGAVTDRDPNDTPANAPFNTIREPIRTRLCMARNKKEYRSLKGFNSFNRLYIMLDQASDVF